MSKPRFVVTVRDRLSGASVTFEYDRLAQAANAVPVILNAIDHSLEERKDATR